MGALGFVLSNGGDRLLGNPSNARAARICPSRTRTYAAVEDRFAPLWLRIREVQGAKNPEDDVQKVVEEFIRGSTAARVDLLRRKKDDSLVLLEAFSSADTMTNSGDEPFEAAEPSLRGSATFPYLHAWEIRRNDDAAEVGSRPAPESMLERLGVKSILVMVGRASVLEPSDAERVCKMCTEEAKRLVQSGEAVRAAAIPSEDRKTMTLISAYPQGSEFALFDSTLGDEYLDDDGWRIERFFSVFPDSSTWALPADVLAEEWDLPELEPTTPPEAPVQGADRGQFFDPLRVWLGVGSLERAQAHIKKQDMTYMAVTGFNQARLDPLAWGLENDADNNVVVDLPGFQVMDSGPVSFTALEEGLERLYAGKHKAVIGYGSGRVLDAARAMAALGAMPRDVAIRTLREAEESLKTENCGISVFETATGTEPLPLILIPNGVGSEAAYLSSSVVRFGSRAVIIQWEPCEERIVASDPRLLKRLPYRLFDVGAAVNLCWCIEALCAMQLDVTASRMAEEGVAQSIKVLLSKFWDREDDDSFFSSLSSASMMAGSARESTGIGLAQTLALAVATAVDSYPKTDSVMEVYTTVEDVLDTETEEPAYCSNYAKALLYIYPCLLDSGLIPNNTLEHIASKIVSPPTAQRLISYMYKQTERVVGPPRIIASDLDEIAKSVASVSYTSYGYQPSADLVQDILVRAGLVEYE